jgi:hypothetical protein
MEFETFQTITNPDFLPSLPFYDFYGCHMTDHLLIDNATVQPKCTQTTQFSIKKTQAT